MKKLLMIFAIAMIANVCPCFASFNEDEPQQENPQHIVVRNESPNFHRTLEVGIFAYYMEGAITLDFVDNLGAAMVSVQNLTDGGQIVELIDTSICNIIDIKSILTTGDYYITITTLSGDIYYADFHLE